MRRLHLIEIHDQAWLPRSLRDAITDTLQHIFSLTDLYAAAVPRLRYALDRADTNQVVDLCSGAGGPWLRMCQQFGGRNFSVDVWLTDKYPNHAAIERVQQLNGNVLRYFGKPVEPAKHSERIAKVSNHVHFLPSFFAGGSAGRAPAGR